MKKLNLLTASLLAIATLTGCATGLSSSNHNNAVSQPDGVRIVDRAMSTTGVTWDKTGGYFKNEAVKAGESRVVFVRPADGASPQTNVVLGIDGALQTSLGQGQYTALKLCSGTHKINAEITGNKSNRLVEGAQSINLQSKSTVFYAVNVDANGKVKLSPVNHQTASKMLQGSQLQTHQVSRVVADNCVAPPVVKEVVKVVEKQAPATPKRFTLSSDFLFDFDKATLRSSASHEIDKMISNIRSQYKTIEQVTVTGHTDHYGSAEYNYDLAQKRAETVKAELVKHGFNSNAVKTASMGETQPVTDGCKGMSKAQAKTCLAPDRRVEVEVIGQVR